ncbi:MAG: hypothetical protein WD794_02800 [Mycobacteriales bacterium]
MNAAVLWCGGADAAEVLAWTGLVVLLTAAWVVLTARSVLEDRSAAPGLLATTLIVVIGLSLSGSDPTVSGLLERWFDGLADSPLTRVAVDQAVVVLGIGLFLTSPANTVVRLVLKAAGSRPADNERSLKGGRLLGPMERLFVFGLGLAGELTAASIIVAAKGLLRFPELQSHRDDDEPHRIDVLTEYFLVGTMASLLLALGLLAVAA